MKVWFGMVLAVLAVFSLASGQGADELRKERDALQKTGSWREALALYRDKISAISDGKSGEDLAKAFEVLRELNEISQADGLLETAVSSKADNPSVLLSAADLYGAIDHVGSITAGEFRRGYKDAAGLVFFTEYRDRVRKIQLLRAALALGGDEKVRTETWKKLSEAVFAYDGSWKLQLLTPLDKLPEWDEPGPSGATEGVPWKDGAPVLPKLPDSWEKAANDGERWRFALAEWSKGGDEEAASAKFFYGQYLEREFGRQTLSGGTWSQADGAKAEMELESLGDDEVIAGTSDGIKRFKLPPDQHFIAVYESLLESKPVGAQAGDRLVSVYLSRKQQVKAAALLERIIGVHGAGPGDFRKELLGQVTGAWGRFEAPDTVAAGTKPMLPVIFRNAAEVSFTAAPVDVDGLLADTREYLKGNPLEIDWQRINPSGMAYRLLRENESKYIGPAAAEWTAALQPAEGHKDKRQDVEMPLSNAGAWWVTATMKDGNTFRTMVWIVDTVLVYRDVAGKRQWWVADAESGEPVPDAEVVFFGYETVGRERKNEKERRFDVITQERSAKTDADGRILQEPADLNERMPWMVVARKEGRSSAFFGFQQFTVPVPEMENGNRDIGYGITDRPAYKPGDTLHVKFFLRNVGYFEPDEAKYAGRSGSLVLFDGRGQEALKIAELRTDEFGAVEASAVIPENAPMGSWSARFSIADQISESVSFLVEEYRKPEFEVAVEGPSEPVKLGGKFSIKVKAAYFHGAPVREASVKLLVKRSPLNDRWFPMGKWDWLYGSGSWWPGVEASWHPGWSRWGCIPPMRNPRWTPPEIVVDRTVEIGPDGTVSVEIDTAAAAEAHGDMDARYDIEAHVTDASRREETASGSVIAAMRPFEVAVWANRGFAKPGEDVEASVSAATLDGRPVVEAEGTLKLLRISRGEDGKVTESEAASWPVKTLPDGTFSQRFAAPDAGQYRLVAELSKGGEPVARGVIFNVHGNGPAKAEEWKFGAIELVADKLEYAAGDTMRLRVNSDRPGAHVWLFLHQTGRSARESKRVVLDGKSLEVEVPLDRRDMPNMFIEAVTVHGACIHSASREVQLPPEKKIVNVDVIPEKTKVAPRSKGTLKISLKDPDGNPVAGKAVVAIYDKAIEAFAGGTNVPPVASVFWGWKNYHYGSDPRCSSPVSPGNLVPPDGKVMSDLEYQGGPFFFGVGMARGNGAMMMKAAPSPVSAMAPDASFDSAAGNAPGGGEGAAVTVQVRKDFADLLKWVGSVTADADGIAEVPLEFPDNLTTWKARVWTIGGGTRIGEGTAEIIATKDLLIRPHFPRFLVERDEAVIGAVVHNEHPVEKKVEVSLKLEVGRLEALSGKPQTVTVPSKGEVRVEWKVKALKEGTAKITMTAQGEDDGDAVERELPVRVHGMARQDAWSVVLPVEKESVKIPFEVPGKLRPEETRLIVRWSPTVAGAVVDALPYLAEYPHGCTEQTLNRFIPAVIARGMLRDLGIDLEDVKRKRTNLNPQEIGDSRMRAEQWNRWKNNPVFDGRELDRMIRSGIEKLAAMQNADGGWGWFSGFGERSYPHTTAVVVNGLLDGSSAGAKADGEVLARGLAWLEEYEKNETAALQRHIARKDAEGRGEKLEPTTQPLKAETDSLDAFVRYVLGKGGIEGGGMTDFLHRDRVKLPAYAQTLLALELHRLKDEARRDETMHVIGQFLKRDGENQTAWLDTWSGDFWWYWYGSGIEANAWYLKLLTLVKPADADTRGLAKYLVNNRRGGHYWNSTRDTAYAIDALAAYAKVSGEMSPEMEVEVLMDGKPLKKVAVTKENLFSFDGTLTLAGNDVPPGKHEIEIRRGGKGTVYANAYLEVFSLEDRLRPAGLEVKIDRKIWKLVPEKTASGTPGKTGQVVVQNEERMKRVALEDGATLSSGDRAEVELIIDSKNDYEYLMFSDRKAAGFEAVEALSGYVGEKLHAYMEPREQSVDFFVAALPRGKHTIRYELRAESPGVYKALPAEASAMYAPELRGNSSDFQLRIRE